MARKTIPRERLQALQKSYDQLCVWLNYDNSTKHGTRRLLDSSYVKPFFREYRRDYLEVSHSRPPVQCADLYHWCVTVNAFAQPQYANADVVSNKRDWTPLDHATRFLVRVLRFSWQNNGEWSSGNFDPEHDEDGENDLEVYQVWAILQYLQAEWEAANVDDWEVDRLASIDSKGLKNLVGRPDAPMVHCNSIAMVELQIWEGDENHELDFQPILYGIVDRTS